METFGHLRVPLKVIRRATKNFDVGNFVAEGGFGKVFRAVFKNNVRAVKVFNRSKEKADVSFMNEIMFLTICSHKNLISLIGFCDDGENRILVYEYACNRSLDFHLTDPSLRWTQRLKICVGTACGLQYLHDPKGTQQRILHRDVKSANILLDKNWNPKIADFGLSRHGPANQNRTFVFSEAKGTLGYCDPVYAEDMLLTKESDVYSFGVVLFELICSRLCVDWSYNDERRSLPTLVKKCHQEQTLHTIIDANLRQQIDQDCFDTYVEIALQCLERERTRRPSMELVVRKLKIALQFQETFDIKEAERSNEFSQKQDVSNLKSQQKSETIIDVNKNFEVKEAKRSKTFSHKHVLELKSQETKFDHLKVIPLEKIIDATKKIEVKEAKRNTCSQKKEVILNLESQKTQLNHLRFPLEMINDATKNFDNESFNGMGGSWEYIGTRQVYIIVFDDSPYTSQDLPLNICVEVACGVRYLHDWRGTQQRVLNYDIKSDNIIEVCSYVLF